MSKILIGTADKQPVHMDIDLLITTRLLIQANSGGGKSFLLRRIAEQAFGKVQIIFIDPEGEFSTLREKHAFALIGKGGESPADVRSAGLVATKLLELNLSAVCDLYEMKPKERHQWVRLFLEALINAPKELWHPVLVIVDEAQLFVPEKGSGESEAADAMIALATLGRKRGFCPIWATQRLSLVRKDATSGMLNRLIGPTFEDVDLDRVANLLSVMNADRRAFFEEMRMLEPGHFYAFGRAISKKRIMVKVSGVETTHPEVGWSKKKAQAAPATPEEIKKFLPRLSDLPKEAEQKARTEQELRAEIAQLKRELATRPVQMEPVIQRVEVPVFGQEEIESIDRIAKEIHLIRDVVGSFAKRPFIPPTAPIPSRPTSRTYVPPQLKGGSPFVPIIPSQLSVPQQKILDAMAWMESVHLHQMKRTIVAFLAGQSSKSSGYTNNLGALRSAGLITYPDSESLAFTDEGRTAARHPDAPLDAYTLQQTILSRLPNPQARILEVLIQAGGQLVEREDLAAQAGQSPTSSGYTNNLGALRSFGVIEYQGKAVRALPVLFLE
jgi:hypothetical protein